MAKFLKLKFNLKYLYLVAKYIRSNITYLNADFDNWVYYY